MQYGITNNGGISNLVKALLTLVSGLTIWTVLLGKVTESHKNLTFLITLNLKLHVYMFTNSFNSTRTK